MSINESRRAAQFAFWEQFAGESNSRQQRYETSLRTFSRANLQSHFSNETPRLKLLRQTLPFGDAQCFGAASWRNLCAAQPFRGFRARQT